MNGAQNRNHELFGQLRKWDQTKPAELRTQFNDLPADQRQNIARSIAKGLGYSEIDPGFAGDAIRSLVVHAPADTTNNPNEVQPNMASPTYAVQLSMNDPAAATS